MTNVVFLSFRPNPRPFRDAMLPRVQDQGSPKVVPLITVRVEHGPVVKMRTRETRSGKLPASTSGDTTDAGEFAAIPIDGQFGRRALTAEAKSGFDLQAFRTFALGLDLRYFTAEDLLCLNPGDSTATIQAWLGCLPPRALWPNMADTARMLDEISHRLAARCEILSTYRCGPYNSRVGGGRASPHRWFNAIDFRCAKGKVADWRRVARAVRASDPRFRGSIGCHADFLHIDTSGQVGDW
ncbi:MAG: D-Ala-D-Ala carboxypeptidase family metallohydrolase [Phreatobacter sp.]